MIALQQERSSQHANRVLTGALLHSASHLAEQISDATPTVRQPGQSFAISCDSGDEART
jgi:hypothetical protein